MCLGAFLTPGNAGSGKDYPSSYKDSDWKSEYNGFNNSGDWTGVIFQRSTIGQNNVKDGASKTYLFGEKFVDRKHTEDGSYFADQTNMYTGMGADNYRTTCVLWTNWPTDTANTTTVFSPAIQASLHHLRRPEPPHPTLRC